MSMDIRNVKLFVDEEGKGEGRRLICTIDSSSKFKTMPWFSKLSNCQDQHLIKAAEEQRDGWKFNGPWPNAKFEIEVQPHKEEVYTL